MQTTTAAADGPAGDEAAGRAGDTAAGRAGDTAVAAAGLAGLAGCMGLPDGVRAALLALLGQVEAPASSVAAGLEPGQEPWLDQPRAMIATQLGLLEASERLAAWAHAQGLAALGGLKVAIDCEVERRIDLLTDQPRPLEELDGWARDALLAEVAVATGWSETDLLRRLFLAENRDGRAAVLLTRLAAGQTTLERALTVNERAANCDPEIANVIAERVLSRDQDGVPVTHERFLRQLRRQLTLASPDGDPAARERALAGRTAHAVLTEDGTGELRITGDGARVVAAMERLDTLARTLRAGGDRRNLAALRSDLALDLLLSGRPDHPDHHQVNTAPPAHVTLIVSLATLLGAEQGVGEIPGYGFVTAGHARQIALAEGSLWRRIVTDPTTGAVLDTGTHTYRPTARMRHAAAVLDGTCRGPGCTQPARTCDLDHQQPWPTGPTTLSNLNHKHRRHHNLKTRGLWTCRETRPGVLQWETLAGRDYLSLPFNYTDPKGTPATTEEITQTDKTQPPPPF